MSNAYERLQKRKKNKTPSASSDNKTNWTAYERLQQRKKQNEYNTAIGFETLESDIKALDKTIQSVYDGWQSEETMNNTRSSIEAMQTRVSAYQDYQKTYGNGKGADLTDLLNSYKSTLEGWDDLKYHYSKYKNADAYKKALADSEAYQKELDSMPSADLNVVQTEIDELQNILDAAKSKRPKTNLTTSTKKGAPAIAEIEKRDEEENEYDEYLKSVGYSSIEDIEKALREKKVYKNKAQRVQDGIYLSSVADEKSENYDPNFNDYSAKGTALGNEETDEWYISGYKNQVAYLRNNPEALEQYFDISDDNGVMVESIMDNQLPAVAAKYMNEDEAKLHDYYVYLESQGLAEEGTATKYLRSIEEKLKQRQSGDVAKERESLFSKYTFGYKAGIDQFTQGMINLFNTDDDYIPPTAIQNASAQFREDINKAHGTFGQGVYDLITTTSNMVPSILASSVSNAIVPGSGAVLGAGLMGGSAAGNAYQEMLNQGYEKGQARIYSTLVGVSEAGLQYAFGGISKLGGKITGQTITAISNGVDNALGRFAIKYGLNMASEGFEEAAQEILNPFFENLALGYAKNDLTDVDWGEVAYSGVLGALSAGLLEGGSTAVSTFNENATAKKTGANIRANNQIGGMLDIASLSQEETDAYNLYTHYANKGVNAENISDLQLGRLHSMAGADAQNTLSSKKSTTEQKTSAKNTLNDLAAFNQNKSAKNLSNKNINELYGYEEATSALIEEGLESGENTESYKLATELKAKLDKGENITTEELAQLADFNTNAYKIEVKNDAERKLTELGETNVTELANIIVKKSNGDLLTNSEKQTLQNNKSATRVYNEINNEDLVSTTENMNDGEANFILSIYDDSISVDSFMNSYNLVKNYSINRFTDDYVLNHRGKLTPSQVSAIYNYFVTNKDATKQKALDDLKLKHMNEPFKFGKFDDSVIDYNNCNAEGKVNWNDLTDNQKSAIAIVGTIAQQSGLDVELILDGYERGINGAFVINGNKILIDVYAGMDKVIGSNFDNFILPTLSHEMTHWMKEKAPELYRKYDAYVFETLMQNGKTEEEILSERRLKMQKAHPGVNYTDTQVRDEVIARASEDMLGKSEVIKGFVDTLSTDEKKTFVKKIREILQNIKDWFNSYLDKVSSKSPEAKKIREATDRIDGQIELWDAMLKSSIETNQALQNEGITGEELANKTSNNVQEMARESLEIYTETQYNNFGWVRYNDVLSAAEYETLLSRYADYKHNKNHYPTTRFGEAVIYSFDYPNILMYVKGTIRNPQIAKVVIIDFELPLITQKTIQKEILSNERNQLSFPYKTVTDFFGKGCFTINKKRDFPSFQEYRRRKEGKLSREDNPSHRIKQDGARNVEKSESFDKSEHIKNSDRDEDITAHINQSMTMNEAKDMIQRAFVLGGIQEWYDGEYMSGDEWLRAQGVDEVALYIENEYALQQKYIDKIQGILEDEFYVQDILNAYLNGTLIGKEKPKAKRLDLSINHRINDTRFYSPQRIENVKQLFEVASQKLTSKNRAEVSNARAKILLFAHNKGASELLGLTQAELNKKLRTWGGYPANARDMSRRFNNGVADSNKWTGIENCSWLYRSTVTTDELESLVKSVTGAADDYEKLYIARTMLALDTHIDWSWISFEFDSRANINKNRNKNDRCNGFYSNDKRKVVVSHNMPNTVAHEMGHALDYQWGRDLGYQYDALTEVSQNTQRITDPQTKQFFDNFKIFMDSLTDNGDISSEYTQNPKEVFARFIARFVEWVDNTGTGNHSYRTESMYYNDKFTASNYIEFVKLLQEKAMLDSKKVAEGEDVKFSDRDIEVYDRTAILKETTIDKYLEDYAAKSSPNYAQAYIAYMSPDRFLKMTTSNRSRIEAESKEFNYDKFTDATLFQPIQLTIDSKTGEVIGHEGRHRMVALSNAGAYNVPVLMFDYSNKTDKENISEMVLHGQFNSYLTTRVEDVIPFSYSNREEIIKNFGTQSSWQKMKERYNGEKTLMYSDRDNVSVYDTMGETDRLIKENEKFKADVERLKERLKIERQVTHGNYFNENQLNTVAGHLRKISNSNYSKPELVKQLKDVYSYIAHSDNLNWEDLMSKSYEVAKNLLSEAREEVIVNDYFKEMLRDIRKTRISLNEKQIQEAKFAFGNNYHKFLFGKFNIAKDGLDLDIAWKQWASKYPRFETEISDADQITELYKIYEEAKIGSEMVVEYNEEERTRWLASEIYNQYWNVSPIRTTADKYDKRIKLLNFEHRRAMKELRDGYNERLAGQKKTDREKYQKLAQEIRKRKEKEIAEVKRLGKERMDKYKENAERKTKIQSITANALTLNKWLTTNSKDYHIHENMKAPVIKLLQAIDFSSKRLLDKNVPTQKDVYLSTALSKVKDMMADATNLKEGLEELYGHDMDEDLAALVDSVNDIALTVGNNEYILNRMSLEELKTLDKLVKTIKHTVTKLNDFHTVHHNKGVVNLANDFMEYGDKLGKLKKQDGKIGKFLKFRNCTPYYFFKRLGEAGEKIFEAFQDGWDKLAFNAKQIIDFTNENYTSREVRDWTKETKTFTFVQPDGEKRTFKMSIAQIMALHCVSKQEDAQRHLFTSGMTLSRLDKKGNVIADYENISLSVTDLTNILSTLTDRQKKVANKLQEFMNTVCSDWGNEISMARFGVKMFALTNYFPIKVSPTTIPADNTKEFDNASLFRLLNMSFTKSRNEYANQSIEIGDIFDIFAQHTTDMAKYNALALPVLDFNKFYSIKGKTNGNKEYGVDYTLRTVFGNEAVSYAKRFVRDINGSQNVSRDVIGKTFFKNAKVAAVANNLRVVLLQPTAYFKAGAVMDNKYLAKAPMFSIGKLKKSIAKAEKYCGIIQWKSLGYYDTDISKGIAEKVKHADTFKDKAVEKSLKGAEIADKVTFGVLWNACELEIRSTRKDLKVGSEDFYQIVGKRLREIVYATQVVDSTMTRSDIMRSADGLDKMLTTFGSEPTIAYNMLMDMAIQFSLDKKTIGKKEAWEKNSKKIRKVITSYVVTNAVAALVESAFDAYRDNDDEEDNIEEFFKAYFTNFFFDNSIGNKIPYVKEIYSALQGYSSSRMDTQWMEYLYSIFNTKSGDKRVKYGLRLLSDISGFAFYNIYRDVLATLYNLDILSKEDIDELFS